MGARLTISLVLLAAVTLVFGFMSHTAWLIYVSIGCSALAAAGLMRSSRQGQGQGQGQGRRRTELEEELAWPAALAAPDGEEFFRSGRDLPPPPRRRGPVAAGSAPPRQRTVGTTLTIPVTTAERVHTEPDLGEELGPQPDGELEPEPVTELVTELVPMPVGASDESLRPITPQRPQRARPPKRNSVASDWVQAVPARMPPTPVPIATPSPLAVPAHVPVPAVAQVMPPAQSAVAARPPSRQAPRHPAGPTAATAAEAAAAAASGSSRRRPVRALPVEEFPFPIEEYDYLQAAEILPLLPELDDQELVEILLHEQAGASRPAIIDRIDALLEGEE